MSRARVFASFPLVASLLLAVPARADEQYDLATDIVSRTAADASFDRTLVLMRGQLVRMIVQKSGKSDAEAASAVDGVLMPSMRSAYPRVRAAVIAIYAKEYSLDDLRGLDTFYRSPVGQHLIAKQPQIGAEMVPAVIAIIQSQLRLTLQQKSDELRKRGVAL